MKHSNEMWELMLEEKLKSCLRESIAHKQLEGMEFEPLLVYRPGMSVDELGLYYSELLRSRDLSGT